MPELELLPGEELVAERRSAPAGLYELLGVDPNVDEAELARAYRRRLRELHPDTRASATNPATFGASNHAEHDPVDLAAVQVAYQVLRDPGRRARYDAERAARTATARPRGTTGSTTPGVRRLAFTAMPFLLRVDTAAPRECPIVAGPVRIDPVDGKW
jgi:DnaJ-class molecular chaperone